MEIGKAFTFVNEDEEWIKKLAIGAALYLVSVLFGVVLLPLLLLLFVVGYQIAIIRNVIDGKERPLPEWEDWGQLFIDGVVVAVAVLIYAIPIILFTICSLALILPASIEGNDPSGGAIAGTVVLSCLVILFAIALAFIAPAIFIQYARTGEFGPLFQVGQVMAIARQNFVDILLVIIATAVAGFIVNLLGAIPICGWFVIIPAGTAWIMYATGHLYGQIGRKMNDKSQETAYGAA